MSIRLPAIDLDMSEAQFQSLLTQTARLFGWRVASFRVARTGSGEWRTPVTGDGQGFPDCVLVHPKHGVIFAELKSDKPGSRMSPHQVEWQEALLAAGQRHFTWRPSGWDAIIEILRGR